jgi:hypothetical protein
MWLFAASALAAAPSTGTRDAPAEEYNRLSEEIGRLAAKSAWTGVERTFEELLRTGVDPSWDDWWLGAQAARATGDLGAARERLRAANAIREDRVIIDTLWDIDHKFGAVALSCDPGSYVTLTRRIAPFDPDLLRAIEFAEAAIHDRCAFDGLLPAGSYTFYDRELEVVAGETAPPIDLRGLEIDRRTRKELKARWLLGVTAEAP